MVKIPKESSRAEINYIFSDMTFLSSAGFGVPDIRFTSICPIPFYLTYTSPSRWIQHEPGGGNGRVKRSITGVSFPGGDCIMVVRSMNLRIDVDVHLFDLLCLQHPGTHPAVDASGSVGVHELGVPIVPSERVGSGEVGFGSSGLLLKFGFLVGKKETSEAKIGTDLSCRFKPHTPTSASQHLKIGIFKIPEGTIG